MGLIPDCDWSHQTLRNQCEEPNQGHGIIASGPKITNSFLQEFLVAVVCLRGCAIHFWKLLSSLCLLHPPCNCKREKEYNLVWYIKKKKPSFTRPNLNLIKLTKKKNTKTSDSIQTLTMTWQLLFRIIFIWMVNSVIEISVRSYFSVNKQWNAL